MKVHSPTLPPLLKKLSSRWSCTLSDMDLIDPYNKQSSANRRTTVFESITLGRSLIKHKKGRAQVRSPVEPQQLQYLLWSDSPRSPPIVSWLSKVMKELATDLALVFTFLFQQSLHTGDLPTTWLTAWIAPIYKKGTWCEPENYHAGSLTCVTCKMLEHIFARMFSHTWTNMVFSPVTIMGSIVYILASHSSCSPFITFWPEWIARSRWIWQCWFWKRHSILFHTCAFSRIWSSLVYTSELLSWIRSFLTARTQWVVIEGCHSKANTVKSTGTFMCQLVHFCINWVTNVLKYSLFIMLFNLQLIWA